MNIAYDSLQHENPPKINSETEKVLNGFAPIAFTPDSVIDIHLGCKDLIKLDKGSESDPMIAFFVPIDGVFTEIARTEVVYNNPNPKFVKFFRALYVFDAQQPIRFMVYDCDSNKPDLKHHSLIGYFQTDVFYLFTRLDQELTFDLVHDDKPGFRGQIILHPEMPFYTGTILIGQLQFLNLKKTKTFAKSNPYFEIAKPFEGGEDLPVYRSEVQKTCQGCTFTPFSISLQNLSNNDFDSPMIISCFDYSKNKTPTLIGQCSGNIQTFLDTPNMKYNLTDSKNKKVGEIIFKVMTYHRLPTLNDHLRHGLQLKIVTAIDFTSSNKEPTDATSLHFIHPYGMLNKYEHCIHTVGSILGKYDNDKQFPVYGFGGKVKHLPDQPDYCFPLTLDEQHPSVNGIDGVLTIYRQAIPNITLCEPTLLTPIIRKAIDMAIRNYKSHIYTILFIITDGIINDMRDAIDAIVDGSEVGLSIIILGVGDQSFDGMEDLDVSEDEPLVSSSGKKMSRDIVQFVPFIKFVGGGVALEREVFLKIPRQIQQFCHKNGFEHLTYMGF